MKKGNFSNKSKKREENKTKEKWDKGINKEGI
jgi:hypothetical protein